jgi:amino acid adenylation domain-containing protein
MRGQALAEPPERPKASISDPRAALLKARLRQGNKPTIAVDEDHHPSLTPDEGMPLSPFQRPLWLDYQLYPDRRSAWVVRGYELAARPDAKRLRCALDVLQARHWALTAAVTADGLMQPSNEPIPLLITQSAGDPWAEAETYCQSMLPAFHLETGCLFRVYGFYGQQRATVVLAMHHILVDPQGLDQLASELARLYASPDAPLGAPANLAAAYGVQWAELNQQRTALAAFWRERLRALPVVEALPWAVQGPAGQSDRTANRVGRLLSRKLSSTLTQRIWDAAGCAAMTPFQWLLAAWCILLGHYSQHADIRVGTLLSTRSARQHPHEQALGYFQNLVILRVDLEDKKTFSQVRDAMRSIVGEGLQHRGMPMDELLRILPDRGTSKPLFSTLFTLLDGNTPSSFLECPLERSQSLDYAGAAFDFSFFVIGHQHSPKLAIEYDSELYQGEDLEAVFDHYQQVVSQCLDNAEQDWRKYSLVGDEHRRSMAHTWQQIARAPQNAERLHSAFDQRANAMPGQVALIWHSGHRRHQMTYQQLSADADAICAFIASQQPSDEPIALISGWQPLAVAAMLGIQRAGRAYLPIDPAYPPSRISHMLKDSACRIALIDDNHEMAGELPVQCHALAKLLTHNGPTEHSTSSNTLAYVIYTSGSSGPPKGVMVSHRAAVYSTHERERVYADHPPKRFLILSSIAFDSSVAGLWWTLSCGGTVILPPPDTAREPDAIAAMIRTEKVTHTLCLPSLWKSVCLLAEAPMTDLRLMIVAGEACDPSIVRSHYQQAPKAALYNEYGPTEMTVWSTWQHLPASAAAPIAIGHPLSQTQVMIIDAWGNLLPDGLTGELCLAGTGIAEGYSGQGQDSDTGFITHPLDPRARAYRTGDRVRQDSTGALYFEGRLDNQVKCRGYRVGVESIEATLHQATSQGIAVLPWQGETLESLIEKLPEVEVDALLRQLGL